VVGSFLIVAVGSVLVAIEAIGVVEGMPAVEDALAVMPC